MPVEVWMIRPQKHFLTQGVSRGYLKVFLWPIHLYSPTDLPFICPAGLISAAYKVFGTCRLNWPPFEGWKEVSENNDDSDFWEQRELSDPAFVQTASLITLPTVCKTTTHNRSINQTVVIAFSWKPMGRFRLTRHPSNWEDPWKLQFHANGAEKLETESQFGMR